MFYASGGNHPTVPYDTGDLWVQGNFGDLYVCITSKDEFHRYSKSDWTIATKYTDDTRAEEVNDDLVALSETESGHYDELSKSIEALNKTVGGIQDNTGSFTEADYNLTKGQVATNKSDIATIKTNATNQHNDLTRKISATNTAVSELKKDVSDITLDNFLAQLGLKVNRDGALCYVASS